MKNYFVLVDQHLSEEDKVRHASALLQGEAAKWWHLRTSETTSFLSGEAIKTIPVFFEQLTARFEPVNVNESYREQLANLAQTGSVTNYVGQFTALACKISDLSKAEAKDRFIRGLKIEVRRYLAPWAPQTMQRAAEIAGAYDVPDSVQSEASNAQGTDTQASGPTPMDLDVLLALQGVDLGTLLALHEHTEWWKRIDPHSANQHTLLGRSWAILGDPG